MHFDLCETAANNLGYLLFGFLMATQQLRNAPYGVRLVLSIAGSASASVPTVILDIMNWHQRLTIHKLIASCFDRLST